MLKNKLYTTLKIILYCFLAVSVIICVRALIVSGIAASTDDEAMPLLTAMVVFYMLLLYAPLPVAFVDMLFCVRYFESDKKTTEKTVANCFFILLSLGMIVSTALMIFGQADPGSPAALLGYLALRAAYLIAFKAAKQRKDLE